MTTRDPFDADFLASLEGDAVPFATSPRLTSWKQQHVRVMDTDDQGLASGDLTVTKITDTQFQWVGRDYMAWRSEEMHGEGFEETLDAAMKAAENWWWNRG